MMCAMAPLDRTSHALDPRDRLAVALDLPASETAIALAHELRETVRWVKVGMELFYAGGPDVVRALVGDGFQVFLDLKLHDIPNTVAGAVRSLSGLGVALLTVHASGGLAMMHAAKAAANEAPHAPRLVGVTVLTSSDAETLRQTGVPDQPAAQVDRLAELAQRAGLDGMVCSAAETAALRARFPSAFLVVPGIRPQGADAGDQRRVATPCDAVRAGASLLVVGRPITSAPDPRTAAEAILHEIAAGLA
jgi:orotidine-5'-phosphate decarboxylase